MPEKNLTNPRGAFRTTTTFVQFKDADGILHDYWQQYFEMESNAAILYGSLVIFTVPTATVPMRVAPAGIIAAGSGYTVKGVALQAATAAGQIIQVCNMGFCEVIVQETPTGAAAFGTRGIISTEAAKVNSAAAPVVAGDLLGDHYGHFLAAQHDETGDLAPFWFEHL